MNGGEPHLKELRTIASLGDSTTVGAPLPSAPMSIEENKAVVRRFIHDGVIGGSLAIIDEVVKAHPADQYRHEPAILVPEETADKK